jgi:hypothetical protein
MFGSNIAECSVLIAQVTKIGVRGIIEAFSFEGAPNRDQVMRVSDPG